MTEKIYLYPVWVRLWHLANAVLFLALLVTGLLLHYTSVNITIIPFEVSVLIHDIAGILLVIMYLFYILGNQFTENGKYYKISGKGLFSRLKKQFLFYIIGIFKKQNPPFPLSKERKFNPMQLFSYKVVMYLLMPLLILSGLALFFPVYIPTQIFNLSGIHLTDIVHIIMGFTLSAFMFIHIYFCTMGHSFTSNFKSMINGWHEN